LTEIKKKKLDKIIADKIKRAIKISTNITNCRLWVPEEKEGWVSEPSNIPIGQLLINRNKREINMERGNIKADKLVEAAIHKPQEFMALKENRKYLIEIEGKSKFQERRKGDNE
jgi:hypothetical protein